MEALDVYEKLQGCMKQHCRKELKDFKAYLDHMSKEYLKNPSKHKDYMRKGTQSDARTSCMLNQCASFVAELLDIYKKCLKDEIKNKTGDVAYKKKKLAKLSKIDANAITIKDVYTIMY